ncbi:MAG: hypothetical protein ACJ0OB_03380 [Flavobacteriaceae bacterium]
MDSLHSTSSGSLPQIPQGSLFSFCKKGLALAHVPENLPFFLIITFIEIAAIAIESKSKVTINKIIIQ